MEAGCSEGSVFRENYLHCHELSELSPFFNGLLWQPLSRKGVSD